MEYQKKDLFRINHILKEARTTVEEAGWPPPHIVWRTETLSLLGRSNKSDLLNPMMFEKDEEIISAMADKRFGQFIYSNAESELFEVMLIQVNDNAIITAIRTRRKA